MATHPSLPSDLWDRTPREVQDYLLVLEARVAALEATVQALRERVQQDSRTASRPPSSEPPERQRPRRQPSGRRRGGQPGHPGQTRRLRPVEDVDVVLPLKPELGGHRRESGPGAGRHATGTAYRLPVCLHGIRVHCVHVVVPDRSCLKIPVKVVGREALLR